MSLRITRLSYGALMAGAAMVVASALPASAQTTWKQVSPDANGHYTCFGYQGSFLQSSHVMKVQWHGTVTDECFGIAPDKSIWHAWRGSNGWHGMGGRADDTFNAFNNFNWGFEARYVDVCVIGSGVWERGNLGDGWSPLWEQAYVAPNCQRLIHADSAQDADTPEDADTPNSKFT